MAGMGVENHAEFGAAMADPDQLQRFLEHQGSWVATVTADRVAADFGDLVSDVDRSAITGDFAEWLAVGFRESVSNGIWGWFDDDLAFIKPWGFELEAISRPADIWQGGQDRMVPSLCAGLRFRTHPQCSRHVRRAGIPGPALM